MSENASRIEKVRSPESFVRFVEMCTHDQAEAREGRLGEDTIVFLNTPNAIILAAIDGATALNTVTVTESLGEEQGGRRAAQDTKAGVVRHGHEEMSAAELIRTVNMDIGDGLRMQGVDPETMDPACASSASATVVRLDKRTGMVDIAQVGDTGAMIKMKGGEVSLAVPLDHEPYDVEALQFAFRIADEQGVSIPDAIRDPRVGELMVKSRTVNNHPDGKGSGVINGNPSMNRYIRSRQIPIDQLEELVLITDGLEILPTVTEGEPDWEQMMRIIEESGLEGLYEEVTRIKNNDAQLRERPRFKKHDDASGVRVRVREAFENARRHYFSGIAFKHLPEMRVLLRGGKLEKNSGWRNVAEHCLTQVAVSEVLGEALQLPSADLARIATTAAVHDWNKRLQREPSAFTPEDLDRARALLSKIELDVDLMNATGVDFIEKAGQQGESTFLERVQFYIDDICRGSDVVLLQERLDEVEARRPDLNADAALTARLGGRYWDKERELATRVEQEIFEQLQAQGISISSAQDVPLIIRSLLRAKIAQRL